jgi:steroid delta-isomerase-like uncharacterized protein
MSIENNKAMTRRFYEEVFNRGNLDLVEEFVSEDFVDHEGIPGLPKTGPKAIRALFEMSVAGFSDLHFTIDELIGEGDKVVARGRMSGTHTGEFMGIPPTNKSVEVQLVDIFEIHDGKATQHWGVMDQAGMMQQLGLTPEM